MSGEIGTMFQHDHPRCQSCRRTEEAWQQCVMALQDERRRLENAYHQMAVERDEVLSIYHSLPTRRNKWAKRLMNLVTEQFWRDYRRIEGK